MFKKIAMITGAGSEPDSWLPVERALKKNYDNIPSCDLNLPFANLIYQLRWLKKYSSIFNNFKNPKRAFKLKNLLEKRLNLYDNLKKDICEEIQESCLNQELKLNNFLDVIIKDHLGNNSIVLTTNWDKLLEKKLGAYIHHIHGSIDNFDSLYLPTEVIEENYRKPHFQRNITGQTMHLLENIDKLIIYGLSLSPLDIELSFILSDTFTEDSPLKEINIFDKKNNIDIVEQRLKFILKKKDITIFKHEVPE
ncbi:AbiH family protein [Leptospira levettii]|uniref:AbiH family protein n=1 Tax=Leptospira levettii TaxID=2023178 RepID=UPI00223D7B53|nr:AbiH family protein [Leptospira levettii]MCW7475579.1 AbiH family protein [Leptospira levettii]